MDIGMGKKRAKPSSSSSNNDGDIVADETEDIGLLKDSIDALRKVMTDGLALLHSEMDKLRNELKLEVVAIQTDIKDLKESLSFTQADVDNLKEMKEDMESLSKKIVDLERQLKEETERNIKLEQYTRRENLRFNNIEETEPEDTKSLICDILQKELGINTDGIRFQAVHRVGRKLAGRHRPIIARFVCREDRDLVWKNKGKLKNSVFYHDVYITEDFARAIQEERKLLIKAMRKARDQSGTENAKVIGRFLYVNGRKYDCRNIPDNLK